jgi:hypothetical protein
MDVFGVPLILSGYKKRDNGSHDQVIATLVSNRYIRRPCRQGGIAITRAKSKRRGP